MNFLDYQYILIESDEKIRELERRYESGDENAGLALVIAQYRSGNTNRLIELLPKFEEHVLIDAGINIDLLRLRKLAISAKDLIGKIDIQNGYEVTKYIINNIKLPKPHSNNRITMMEILEPFLPLLAQDTNTAYGSAVTFKFVWEEIENRNVLENAQREIAKSTKHALDYFVHYARTVNHRERRFWPWRFGDLLGDEVLFRIASNQKMAMTFARVASHLDPTKEPWPSNTLSGFKALSVIARDYDLFEEYLNLPQGSLALNNPKIKSIAHRIQFQNYQ